jgi:hypothetical protein
MGSDTVALIAAAAVLLGFITAVLGLISQRRAQKSLAIAEKTAGKVQSISVQVDGRLSTLIERQAQLIDALHASGTPVPPRPPETPQQPPQTEGGGTAGA